MQIELTQSIKPGDTFLDQDGDLLFYSEGPRLFRISEEEIRPIIQLNKERIEEHLKLCTPHPIRIVSA